MRTIILIIFAIMLAGTTSCATSAGVHNRHIRKLAKIEARAERDSISAHRAITNHNYNGLNTPYYYDPYRFNRFTAGFQGRYFYQSHPIIVRRANRPQRRVVRIAKPRRFVPKVRHNNPNSRQRTTPNVVRRPVRTKNKQ